MYTQKNYSDRHQTTQLHQKKAFLKQHVQVQGQRETASIYKVFAPQSDFVKITT